MCDAAKAVLRGAFSDTGLPQETRNQKKRKISNNQPNPSSKGIRKEKNNKQCPKSAKGKRK